MSHPNYGTWYARSTEVLGSLWMPWIFYGKRLWRLSSNPGKTDSPDKVAVKGTVSGQQFSFWQIGRSP